MFSKLFPKKEIKLIKVNEPKGREPKIWRTDTPIKAFEQYLVDEEYSLPTKAIEKAFLDEVKEVEKSLNDSFEEVLAKLKQLKRIEHEGEQNGADGKWKETRNMYFTSTRTMFNEYGNPTPVKYEVMAYLIAKGMYERGEYEKYIAIIESMGLSAVKAMANGTKKEKRVREKLEKILGEEIVEKGMVSIAGSLLGDSVDGSFIASKDITIKDFTIPKGSSVGIEIKNPKFSAYLDPNYMKKYSSQCQQHLFVGGFDYVITAKAFDDYEIFLDVVEPDEKFFRTLIEKYDEEEREIKEGADNFIDKYSLGF